MKFLKKLKSSNFWVSMISAVVLILQAVFNVEIKTEYLNQIIMAILGLLVMSGIVTDSSNNEMTVNQSVDTDSLKEDVSKILTQVSTTFETSLSGFIKQFEVIKNNLSVTTNQSKTTENVTTSIVEEENIENVEQKVENKNTQIIDNENIQPNVVEKVVINTVNVQQNIDDENVL